MVKAVFSRCIAITFALILFQVGSASATLLYYEGFDYPTGDVLTAGTAWDVPDPTGFPFNGAATATFDAGSLSYPLLATTGNHLAENEVITDPDKVTYTPNNSVPINGVFSQAGTYYLTLVSQVQTDSAALDGLGVFALNSSSGFLSSSAIQLAMQSDGSGGVTPSMEAGGAGGATNLSGAAFTPSGAFLIAIRVINQAGDDDVRMIINPDLSAGEPDWSSPTIAVTNRDIAAGAEASAGVYFSRAQLWDELRVATTWSEAAPLIPEPASLALIGLGGLLALSRRNH